MKCWSPKVSVIEGFHCTAMNLPCFKVRSLSFLVYQARPSLNQKEREGLVLPWPQLERCSVYSTNLVHAQPVRQWRSQTRAHPGLGPDVSIRNQKQSNTVVLSYSIAICNDALFYTLLTSLFACLAFNTGEDLYCVQICWSHGSELLPIQERRHLSACTPPPKSPLTKKKKPPSEKRLCEQSQIP